MQRRTLIAVAGAALVGSSVGTAAALLRAHLRGGAPVVAARDAGIDAVAVAPGDAQAILVAQMRSVLGRFALWSREHAGAPCPDLLALGVPTLDPWGHDLVLTCTDQPANQRAGAVSAGPDGALGTEDDIASWTLGSSVTKLVLGPRWQPLAPAPTPPGPTTAPPAPTTAPPAPATAPPAPATASPSPTTAPPATATTPGITHPAAPPARPTRPPRRSPSQPSPTPATSPPRAPADSAPPSGSAAPPPSDTDDIPSRRSPR
jgi:hypothetical protein